MFALKTRAVLPSLLHSLFLELQAVVCTRLCSAPPPDSAASLSVGLQRRLGEDRRGRAAPPEKPLQSSGCGGGGATLRTVRTAECISPIIRGSPIIHRRLSYIIIAIIAVLPLPLTPG